MRWVSHAEANALCNAARSGTPVRGATHFIVARHGRMSRARVLELSVDELLKR